MVVPVEVTSLDCTVFRSRSNWIVVSRFPQERWLLPRVQDIAVPPYPNSINTKVAAFITGLRRLKAALCRQEEVVLVGGGNAAGQAIVFLASHATHVHHLIRGSDLEKSMSKYLIDCIGSLANVTLPRADKSLVI